jgi:hypothetical protein
MAQKITQKRSHNHPVEIHKEIVHHVYYQIKKDLKCTYGIKPALNLVLFSQEMFNNLSAVLRSDTQYLSQAIVTNPQPSQEAVRYREISRTDYPVALRHIRETPRPHSIVLYEVRFPL